MNVVRQVQKSSGNDAGQGGKSWVRMAGKAEWTQAFIFPLLPDVVVQSLSGVLLFVTPWSAAHQAPLASTVSRSLPIDFIMLSNHFILCCPLLLLPSILPSTRVFSSELPLYIRWPKRWSFSFSNRPSNEYLGLTSLGLTGLYFQIPHLFRFQGNFRT